MLLLVTCLALFGFFSAVEVALVSVSRIKARSLYEQKKRGSNPLMRLKKDPDRMLTTILIGTNVVNVSASAIATYIATNAFGDLGLGIATGVMTLTFLVFGEIVPKTYAASHYEKIALLVAGPIELLQKAMSPFVAVFSVVTDVVKKMTGGLKGSLLTEEDLKTVVKVGYEQEVLDEKDKQIIEGVIRFDDIEVEKVMTPIDEVFFLTDEDTIEDALMEFSRTKYSRAVLFKKTDQNDPIGVVNLRDLVRVYESDKSLPLKEISNTILITPANTRVNKLLIQMQKQHQHIALVEKENEAVGVVTFEDLIEEILGEIWDEQDLTPDRMLKRGRNTYLAHGKTKVGLIREKMGVNIGKKESEMDLDAFLKDKLMDRKSVTIDGVRYEVLARKGSSITTVRIKKYQ